MTEWWSTLSGIHKFFYFIAIPSTVILILQFILSLLGIGGDADLDGDIDLDIDGDSDVALNTDDIDGDMSVESLDFRFVTFRGIIAFATIFGWVGLALLNTPLPLPLVLFLSFISGLAAMGAVAYIFYFISTLQSSGNIQYKNALGCSAEVYLTIPPKGEGYGKVQLVIQERLVEVDAISSSEQSYQTGDIVRVTDILNKTILIVEKE